MQIINESNVEETPATRVWAVAEFCRRYRLDQAEETRLRILLGDFASQQELLMNAQRKPVSR